MAEDELENIDPTADDAGHNPFEKQHLDDKIVPLNGLYQNWFLDYASYVILERAVPSLYDGLKPVQRRILHSMREMEDGRYNKVANIIGNTMKYTPMVTLQLVTLWCKLVKKTSWLTVKETGGTHLQVMEQQHLVTSRQGYQNLPCTWLSTPKPPIG